MQSISYHPFPELKETNYPPRAVSRIEFLSETPIFLLGAIQNRPKDKEAVTTLTHIHNYTVITTE